MMTKSFAKNKLTARFVVVFLVVMLGLALRLFGNNWDGGHHLHPDERMLIIVAQRIDLFSKLNPDFFNYGSLPVYVLAASAEALDVVFDTDFDTYDGMLYLGRSISTIADMMVLVLVGLIAYVLSMKELRITLGAMFVYAMLFFPIQNSNFFIVDNFLTLFLTMMVWLMLKMVTSKSMKAIFLLGAVYGAALATKVTPMLLLPVLVFSALVKVDEEKVEFVGIINLLKRVSLLLVSTGFFFALLMPYALIEWERFISDVGLQVKMNSDAYVFPYTLQYVGTTAYLFHLKQMWRWGVGPLVSILGLLGVGVVIKKVMNKKWRKWSVAQVGAVMIGVMVSMYFIVIGRSAVKFMRYLLPIYPYVAIAAGFGLDHLVKLINNKGLSWVLVTIVLMMQFGWVVGFVQIYSRPHPRVEASEWMKSNIPPRSVLAVEHWDDRLPLEGGSYRYEELQLYNVPDGDDKWEVIDRQLGRADYLILASNRLYAPLQRLDDCEVYEKCYPKTAKYYEDLFAGKLDFEMVAEFSSYPKFMGYELVDDNADESFTVYDHPKVIVFEKK